MEIFYRRLGFTHTVAGRCGHRPLQGPSGNFVFSGTGWGHNVGLSQNGAKGMALKGMLAEDIIRFYYTGVEITGQ